MLRRMPPLFKMPCCHSDCQLCAAHQGGLKFLWLGLWNSLGVVLPPDVSPSNAWQCYYDHQDRMCSWRPTALPSLPKSWCFRNCAHPSSSVQRVALDSWGGVSCSPPGVTGHCASPKTVFRPSSPTHDGFPDLAGGDPGPAWVLQGALEDLLGLLRWSLRYLLLMEAQLRPVWGETENVAWLLKRDLLRLQPRRSIFLLSAL